MANMSFAELMKASQNKNTASSEPVVEDVNKAVDTPAPVVEPVVPQPEPIKEEVPVTETVEVSTPVEPQPTAEVPVTPVESQPVVETPVTTATPVKSQPDVETPVEPQVSPLPDYLQNVVPVQEQPVAPVAPQPELKQEPISDVNHPTFNAPVDNPVASQQAVAVDASATGSENMLYNNPVNTDWNQVPSFDAIDITPPVVPVETKTFDDNLGSGSPSDNDLVRSIAANDAYDLAEAEPFERYSEADFNKAAKDDAFEKILEREEKEMASNRASRTNKDSKKSIRNKKDKNKKDKDNGGKKKSTVVIIILLLLLIAAVGVGGYFVYQNMNKPAPTNPTPNGGIVIDTDQDKATGSIVNETEATTAMFTATGYYDMDLKKGDVVYLTNDAENKTDDYTVYLQYILTEVDENGVETDILTTGLIEPSMQVTWNPYETLKSGEHTIHIIEQPYTEDTPGDYTPRFSCDQFIKITLQ